MVRSLSRAHGKGHRGDMVVKVEDSWPVLPVLGSSPAHIFPLLFTEQCSLLEVLFIGWLWFWMSTVVYGKFM